MPLKKRYIIILFILSITNGTFLIAESIDISRELDYIIFDTSDNFLLQLGNPYHFLLKKYNIKDQAKLLIEYSNPKYSIYTVKSDGFSIRYSTFYERIDAIEIYSEKFSTVSGVTIGSNIELVKEKYGTPWYSEGNEEDPLFVIYKKHIPSINHQAEYTYFRFDFVNGQVFIIDFYIESRV